MKCKYFYIPYNLNANIYNDARTQGWVRESGKIIPAGCVLIQEFSDNSDPCQLERYSAWKDKTATRIYRKEVELFFGTDRVNWLKLTV